uniref:Uncharacterized protein n=1 Tax=Globodera pallida TaxID=36090 RepID=A0A183CB86_GLOPA
MGYRFESHSECRFSPVLKQVIKAEDVTEFFEQLCKLLIFGKSIKQMYEKQQMTLGRQSPKQSRNGIPGNQVEQYLNKLEQQSLLNSYAKPLFFVYFFIFYSESELLQQQQRIVQQKRQYYGNLPLVGSVYNRVRPYPTQLPQLQ